MRDGDHRALRHAAGSFAPSGKSKHLPGDPDHRFLVRYLQPLIEDNATLRERILQIRTYRAVGGSKNDSGEGIPPDCLSTDERCVQVQDLRRYASGEWGLRPAIVRQIALDHGLGGHEREVFLAQGAKYCTHCQRLAEKESKAELIAATRKQSAPASSEECDGREESLKEVLKRILDKRYLKPYPTDIVVMENGASPPKGCKPLTVTQLRTLPSFDGRTVQQQMLFGSRPSRWRGKNPEDDQEQLEELLKFLEVDPKGKEAAAARDALERELAVPATVAEPNGEPVKTKKKKAASRDGGS